MTRPGEHDFPVRSATDIYSGRVMALRSDRVGMPGGRVATREILEHPGAVAVVAVDGSGRVRMLHQYRHAVRRRLWELPAGLLDVAGEDPAVTADRELTEEAGLSARDWSVLLDVVPSPGFSDESVRIFLARDLVEKPRPDLGDDEEADLELRWIPIAEALGMVFSGEIVNAVSCAGLLAARAVLAGEFDPRPVDAEWVDRPFRFARRADE
ncbi:NUDIX domain-containing protein [Pseudonocardia sp. HH130629-09]|uniref:NUDIX domain-containing protein n=1 Tax=Pseudonocardia sp. HH130629-09 TaxID=1641402 RepID=UPI0006CB597B|nr:NUDIX hydrolase [Pseudonocardia sp. HH130629-09]ALE84112.1 ADP-ribose pyrophosphatase [Pseudonocardia sp. HH130629-09]